jgi:hypothetical protein
MTNCVAPVIGHQRYNAVASFSQLPYEFSLRQLLEGRRDHLVDTFPVARAFIADVNPPRFEHGTSPQPRVGPLGIEERRKFKLRRDLTPPSVVGDDDHRFCLQFGGRKHLDAVRADPGPLCDVGGRDSVPLEFRLHFLDASF